MIFRVHDDETMYVIEAPEGSRILEGGDRPGELVLVEVTPGGTAVERRLPATVVIKAARRGCLGLAIREEREPWAHPEVAPGCPARIPFPAPHEALGP